MSAGLPTLSEPPGRPNTRAGFVDHSATSRTAACRRDQQVVGTRDRGLEADDAERRQVELDVLLVAVCGAWSVAMQSMVPSRSAVEQRRAVRLRAQRRVHLGVGVVAASADRLVGQRQVVRRHLAGDRARPRALPVARRRRAPPRSRGARCAPARRSAPRARTSRAHHDLLGRRRACRAGRAGSRPRPRSCTRPRRSVGLLAVVDDRRGRSCARTRARGASARAARPAGRRRRTRPRRPRTSSPISASSSPCALA